MTTDDTAPGKPNQETWLDWLGPDGQEPDELFTRAAVVDRANARGVDQSHGRLPHPTG